MNIVKRSILKETFEKTFDIEQFRRFTKQFFNEPEMMQNIRKTTIWREYTNYIVSYHTIAKYVDVNQRKMIVLAVELKKNSSIDRARSMQRNFVSKVLDENNLDSAIVAFYTKDQSSWRLSFVKLDYSFTEKGINLELTPAKRYSYLLGENEPNHTAQAQLLPIFENDKTNPTIVEIENAFSVEKVTKEFFAKYKDKYLDLKEHLQKNDGFIKETKKLGFEVEKFAEQFAKKTMGQLAFLYFLQKKGWLGVRLTPQDRKLTESEYLELLEKQDDAHKSILKKMFKRTKDGSKILDTKVLHELDDHQATLLSDCFLGTKYDMLWGSGNKTFIREIFDFCHNNTDKNFFNDYLQPFFYEALNTKRNNHYYKRFNCKIPFLNGGLFEPLEDYHWKDVDFNIPNHLFSNTSFNNREADGILDIFDRFNFTINEDEPLEKEVAIDPEMLGKIFENLLEVNDRKSKGAFYTPREIVHYMCQESLISYLINEVKVPYDDIKEFIIYSDLIKDADSRSGVGYGREFTIKQSILDNIVEIDEALNNVRVADPAVGSGAFPLGMLNEIVKARNNITDYLIKKDKEGAFGTKYGEIFIRRHRSTYKMKWDTIKNCIFAVDIEPSAVDITKLRLWLSVVVEQEIDDENPEPHPLPNLDMNIHVGNSLIDEYEGIKLFDETILRKHKAGVKKESTEYLKKKTTQLSFLLDHSDGLLKEMFSLQDKYFDEENEDKKKKIKNKIDKIRDELISYKLRKDGNEDKLAKYETSLKNKTKPYFIWELEFARIFQEKGGFDIVIGNPPYIQLQKNNGLLGNQLEKQDYKVFERTGDIYCLFYEQGINLLKENGNLCYITSNKWLRAGYGKKLRGYFSKLNPVILLNLGPNVFASATVDTNILLVENTKNKDVLFALTVNDITKNLGMLFDKNKVKLSDVSETAWFIGNDADLMLKKKIELAGIPLKDWDINIYRGVLTGLNEAFVIDASTRDALIQKDPQSAEILKPILRGRDINKYYYNWANLYLIQSGYNIDLPNKYPAIYDYLLQFKEKAERRGDQGKHWWNLRACKYYDEFEEDKIVWADIATKPTFAWVEGGIYFNNTAYMINNSRKYILGILNSSVVKWLFPRIGSSLGNNGARYFKQFVERIPIPEINDLNRSHFLNIESLVEELISSKSNNLTENLNEYEDQIDQLVYEIYGLTEEEIKIVEGV